MKNISIVAVALFVVFVLGIVAATPSTVVCDNCQHEVKASAAKCYNNGETWFCQTCIDNGALVQWYKHM